MFSDLEIVERCLTLLSRPNRWTTGVIARDAAGKPVPVYSDDARSFDLEGAIRRSATKDDAGAYARFVSRSIPYRDKDGNLKTRTLPGPLMEHVEPFKNPFDWNDKKGRTHKDVVRLLEDLADSLRYSNKEAA